MADQAPIVGLDIGTSKIGVIIGEQNDQGQLNILGTGIHPSEGLRRGVVVNLDKTVNSIRAAVSDAELMAGVKVQEAVAGIAGDHIKSLNSRGVVAVADLNREISPQDIDRAIDAAKAIPMPMDRQILHILPQEYIVDSQEGIKEPAGMCGVRLEVDAHIVTGAITSGQNILKAAERAGVTINQLVLEPLASNLSVLGEDERELGVALLDIGAGTSDIAMFFEGTIRHSAVVGLGGQNVTNDIALGLRTPHDQAEQIKRQYGCAYQGLIQEEEYIEVPGIGGRPAREVFRAVLSGIIQPRMEEIFSLVHREMKRTEYMDLMTTGLVITGGASLLNGVPELAEEVFDMPVKIGYPTGFGGLTEPAQHPSFATGVGLVQFILENQECMPQTNTRQTTENTETGNLVEKVRQWFREFL